MKKLLVLSLIIFGTTTAVSAQQTCKTATVSSHRKADIVDTAIAAKKFETLVAAVKAAGLVDTLKSKGPFTVFAPLDSAFAKLPKGTVDELLKPENRDKLKAILTYHVVPGKVMAKDAIELGRKGAEAKTVQGSHVRISLKEGAVYVDKAKVVKTDIVCENGVIHVIDAVIMPGN